MVLNWVNIFRHSNLIFCLWVQPFLIFRKSCFKYISRKTRFRMAAKLKTLKTLFRI